MMVVFHEFSILIDMDRTIRQRLRDFEVYCLRYYVVAKGNSDHWNHANIET